ncbi:hypothetical protein HPB51_005895 [Rhipicephalus microplus]|uniref:YitH/HolE acetyltransferase (GNAT) domain-containing protein n=1 Tax=Rhipicephalus microplus TaxID=6941 RepID=A0A9J6D472_RHIMP|nr:hypothetical protein HPB51_005895 [Rhipicephalus microplus]
MVMAEEQMLVNEIFDHMTSGTRLNELAPIIVSPAASLTAIRNAYAEAVARRVLGNQLHGSNESILSASQKAKFYESGPGVNLQKTPSSTSVHSVPSVESYIVQTMLDGGVIRNFKELWGKVPYTLNNAIVSRSRSLDALANTKTSTRTTAASLPKSSNAGHEAPIEMGAGNKENFTGPREETPPYVESVGISERNAEDLMAEALTEDIPSCATLGVVVDETDAAPNFVETKQSTGAATLVQFHKQTCSPSFPSSEGTARESERTTTAAKAVATTPKQRPWVKQNSSESLNNAVDVDWSDCVCCKKYTSPDKSFESFICFGLHETPKYFAPVPVDVSGVVKLRIATDADVREIMSLPWKEPEFKYVLPAAIATRHVLCPSTFFVAVDTLLGHICGAASVLVFDDEVAFCGFCHVRETYAFEHIGVLLWNQMLHVTSGKNLFTVLPEPAFRELHEIYPFSSDPSTDIMLGQARFSRSAFKRTVLVVEYKEKYFDALAAYDKRVFGFSRKRFLTSTVHEVGLNVRLATRNERNVCGYGSVQRGDDGRVVLRWLFADDVETAQSLLSSLLASCSHDDEVDVVAAFYLRSLSTRPILDKVSSHELKPWRLVFTKREPLHSYGRVVCLTTV